MWRLGGLIVSSGNPLDLHDMTMLVVGVTSKYLYIGWKTKSFWVPLSSKLLLPQKEFESNVSNFSNCFSISKCFVLFEVIFLLRLDSLASISVFVIKFDCATLSAIFSAVNLVNTRVEIYVPCLWSLIFFLISLKFLP